MNRLRDELKSWHILGRAWHDILHELGIIACFTDRLVHYVDLYHIVVPRRRRTEWFDVTQWTVDWLDEQTRRHDLSSTLD